MTYRLHAFLRDLLLTDGMRFGNYHVRVLNDLADSADSGVDPRTQRSPTAPCFLLLLIPCGYRRIGWLWPTLLLVMGLVGSIVLLLLLLLLLQVVVLGSRRLMLLCG